MEKSADNGDTLALNQQLVLIVLLDITASMSEPFAGVINALKLLMACAFLLGPRVKVCLIVYGDYGNYSKNGVILRRMMDDVVDIVGPSRIDLIALNMKGGGAIWLKQGHLLCN